MRDKSRFHGPRTHGPQARGGSRPASTPHRPPRHEQRRDARPEAARGATEENEPGVPTTEDGPIRIFGIHAVAAALGNTRRHIVRLELTDNAENRLADALKRRGVKHVRVHPRDLDRKLGSETVHQGALLTAEPLPQPSFDELAARVAEGHPLVVLDQVTDPHNVGAILRSAAVFQAAGLVLMRRHAPPLSGALAKAASGALEHVPVALVPNLARALEELADRGVRRIGLDGEADILIEQADVSGPIALVLGSEGRGLRRLTREACDQLVRIGGSGAIASLNVSNAAAIAMHVVANRPGSRR